MAQYDAFAANYDQAVSSGPPMIERSYRYILELLGQSEGRRICDVGCGQGELARRLARQGACVTGVDNSGELLSLARTYADSAPIRWVQDDAQRLENVDSNAFDIAVANLMLMDVPDYRAVFRSVHRILKADGVFVWVIMHPVFQSPHSEALEDGARKIVQYDEQWWKSGGKGTIRGTLGAYHRPLAAYVNAFVETGFRLLRMDELTIPREAKLEPGLRCHYHLPPLLGAVGRKG